jgi:hypothetical protein
MKKSKFKKGDRVVALINQYRAGDVVVKAGHKGTILEETDVPFVEWDKFVNGHSANGLGKKGHCWCNEGHNLKKVPWYKKLLGLG